MPKKSAKARKHESRARQNAREYTAELERNRHFIADQRAQENAEHRLERHRIPRISARSRRQHQSRARRNEQQHAAELEANRHRIAEHRTSETEEQHNNRLQHQQQYQQEDLEHETQEHRNAHLQYQQQYQEEALEHETEQHRNACLQQKWEHQQQVLEHETEEHLNARLQQQQQYQEKALEHETEERRNTRLQQKREHQQQVLEHETEEHLNARLQQQREYQQRVLEHETEEHQNARLQHQKQYHGELLENETLAEAKKRMEIDAMTHRQKRREAHEKMLKDIEINDMCLSAEELQAKMQAHELYCRKNPDHKESFFQDANKSLPKALLQFYINSGCFQFDEYKEYSLKCKGEPVNIEGLLKEIEQEKLTNKEMEALMRHFYRAHSYTDPKLYSCGACGVLRDLEQGDLETEDGKPLRYERFQLSNTSRAGKLMYTAEQKAKLELDMVDPFYTVDIPINSNWEMKTVQTWKARSFYIKPEADGDDSFWHVHPELVDVDPETSVSSTMLCPHCVAALEGPKLPEYSIANGVDFGFYARLGLAYSNLQ